MRLVLCCCLLYLALPALAAPPASQPAGVTDKLPHIQVDVKHKSVRVECESCNAHQDVGLEFFCVTAGGNEYESVLRTEAKPSNIHLALLMIGLQPGEPVKYSEATKKWIPPHGPPLRITCEFVDKDGKSQRVPAARLMKNHKTGKEPGPFNWVFVGSRVMEDGKYAADATGYVVSVLNSELTVIDIAQLAGTALESRELDRNEDLMPGAGKKIWMVIEPVGKKESDAAAPPLPAPQAPANTDAVPNLGTTVVEVDAAGKVKVDGMIVPASRLAEVLSNRRVPTPVKLSTANSAPTDTVREVTAALQEAKVKVDLPPAAQPSTAITDVHADDALIKRLRERWQKEVAPHDKALREAAQAHYEVIDAMRREQQRLIDEADRIQRTIDELQKEYQEMTTPRPEEK
jgi:biopolymer transport protein ExbD